MSAVVPNRGRKWTAAELEELDGIYPTASAGELEAYAYRVDRTLSAIRQVAHKRGLIRDRGYLTTELVVETVRELGSTTAAAARLGVGKTAISYHLTKAGENLCVVRPDDERLRAAWKLGGGNLENVKRLLGCGDTAARKWFRELGLFTPRAYDQWTPSELAVVELEYDYYRRRNSLDELAGKLNRSRHSLNFAARKLGLKDRGHDKAYRRGPKALTNAQLRAYLKQLRRFDGTAADWQRAHNYPSTLIDEIRRRLPAEWEAARVAAGKRDGTSRVHIGKSFEKQLMKEVRALARANGMKFDLWDNANSLGAGDVIAAGHGRWYVIQAETTTAKHPSTAKWNRLYEWATQHQAVPLYARTGPGGKTEFWRIDGPRAGGRGQAPPPMTRFEWADEFERISQNLAAAA